VNSVFEILKGDNVELGKIVALGQTLASKVGPSLVLSLVEKKALVSEIVQKAVERVELNVLSKLSDVEKGTFSQHLSLVVSQLKEKTYLLLDTLSVKNPYFSYFFGLCCGGGPLPDESSVVKMVVDKVQDVQTMVQEQAQVVQGQIQTQIQTQIHSIQEEVQEVVQHFQATIQESVDHQVALTLLEPPSDEPAIFEAPPASKVVEENPVVVASKAPEHDLD
jgi:hypothetical protein